MLFDLNTKPCERNPCKRLRPAGARHSLRVPGVVVSSAMRRGVLKTFSSLSFRLPIVSCCVLYVHAKACLRRPSCEFAVTTALFCRTIVYRYIIVPVDSVRESSSVESVRESSSVESAFKQTDEETKISAHFVQLSDRIPRLRASV